MLNALFRWLAEQRDVFGDPVRRDDSAAGSVRRRSIRRALADSKCQAVRSLADPLEGSHGCLASVAQRLRFLLDFLYGTGLRAHCLVSATFGGRHPSRCQRRMATAWAPHRQGARPGTVARRLTLAALGQYLLQRGSQVTRRRWLPSTPAVASLGPAGHGAAAIACSRQRQSGC
ncbi:hypothetical protein OKW39_003605 [Paraburkholderia sp. MM6662-R1]